MLLGVAILKGFPDKVSGVSRAKLSHRFGAMTFECPRANAHPQGTLFVGTAFADQVQNLPLAIGQRLPAGVGYHRVCRADGFVAMRDVCLEPNRPMRRRGFAPKAAVCIRDLPDQSAHAIGLLQGVFDHLLQIGPVTSGFCKLMAMLPDLTEINQKGGQGTVEIVDDGGNGLISRPRMRRGEPKNFKAVVAQWTVFDPF